MNWALDTNVLLRFLVGDDGVQRVRVARALERAVARGDVITLSLPVLLEAEWVLRSRYGFAKPEILRTFHGLLDSAELQIDHDHTLIEALHLWAKSRADFADCLFAAHHRRLGCRATWSFDARALGLPGFAPVPS